MPVFYGPLAPLPEGGRRGRSAREAYYGGEGPIRAKMRQLMVTGFLRSRVHGIRQK